jgi:hypothetical protein
MKEETNGNPQWKKKGSRKKIQRNERKTLLASRPSHVIKKRNDRTNPRAADKTGRPRLARLRAERLLWDARASPSSFPYLCQSEKKMDRSLWAGPAIGPLIPVFLDPVTLSGVRLRGSPIVSLPSTQDRDRRRPSVALNFDRSSLFWTSPRLIHCRPHGLHPPVQLLVLVPQRSIEKVPRFL